MTDINKQKTWRRLSTSISRADRIFAVAGVIYFFVVVLFFFIRPWFLTFWSETNGAIRSQVPAVTSPVTQKPILPNDTIRWTLSEPPVQGIPELEDMILKEINRPRKGAGFSELVSIQRLQKIARAHSKDMGERAYFSHNSLDGVSPMERVYSAERRLIGPIGENIFMIKGISQEIQKEQLAREITAGFMNSPPHRANIMSSNFTHSGVGCYLHQDCLYTTLVFANLYAYLDNDLPTIVSSGGKLSFRGSLAKRVDPLKTTLVLWNIADSKNRLELGPKWLDHGHFQGEATVTLGKGVYFFGMVYEKAVVKGPLVVVK